MITNKDDNENNMPITDQLRTIQPKGSRMYLLLNGLALCALALVPLSEAAEFACRSGDEVCLIRAVETANSNGEANTITLEAGTYTLKDIQDTTNGPTGLPAVRGTLTIRGAGAALTSIIGRTVAPIFFRLIHVSATGVLRLDALTLSGGNLPTELGTGAGILNDGTLYLTNSNLADNQLVEHGGGQGTGGIQNNGTAILANSLVTGNFSNFGTAGIENSSTGRLVFNKSTLADNGGGQHRTDIAGLSNQGSATLTDCSIFGNNGPLGGIVNVGTLTLVNCTVADNRSTISSGGGIRNSGTLTLINSTVAGNTADEAGGGIENSGTGTVRIINSTIARNRALTMTGLGGGGILNSGTGTVTVKNSIVAQNEGTFSSNCLNSGAGTIVDAGNNISIGPNIISNGMVLGCFFHIDGDVVDVDPLLDTSTPTGLQNNGGPTQTIALLPGSPAINAIPPPDCTDLDVPPNLITTDQRGFHRPFGAACDIGAFEFGVAKVNNMISRLSVETSFDPRPVPGGLSGTFTVTPTLTNASTTPIVNPIFEVVELSGGNLLLNADGGPAGVGARLTLDVGPSGVLLPGASFTANPMIGLQTREPFTFFVDVLGVPNP